MNNQETERGDVLPGYKDMAIESVATCWDIIRWPRSYIENCLRSVFWRPYDPKIEDWVFVEVLKIDHFNDESQFDANRNEECMEKESFEILRD
ncbi:hypothetical protein CHS0354_025576 [Potamilus streckersoni]|uniref:Uncharacterized protein n=1 Tax=Potamilus streckersoni TaxID=2493646 RepID=A0AAE0S1N0_9BIVA|nr:hypothetical protein CHS0354_025576 [Potamilus streckersoni]